MQYAGKKVIVIGGTHGMGLAAARQLIAQGAAVLVTGANPANVAAAGAALGDGQAIRSDVSQPADLGALSGIVQERFGTIDAVLVFAGLAELNPVEATSVASFDRHFAVNARGVFFALQALLPHIRRGGAIVVTTVTPGTASRGMAAYMASKAAVLAYARVMAAELVERDIRVNAVAPGFIDTPTLGIAGMGAAEREAFSRAGDALTPMRRHGTADEVARAAIFLAFEATFTTGVEFAVDGGLSEIEVPAA